MRSRWFHAPQLHTAHDEEKKVTWLELFYDLIFVAGIIQLGDALSDGVARGEGIAAAGKFAAHFVPLWIAWTGFTFHANRFDYDDFLHRMVVFAQMFSLGAMAIASPIAMGPRPEPRNFALAFAVAQALIALMHFRTYRQVPAARGYSRYWGAIFAFGSVLWLIAGFVATPWCYLLWAAGVFAILLGPLSRQSRELMQESPIDLEHLSERYGLLTIIVLGESFVKVLSYLTEEGHGTDPVYLLKGGLNLLITCCIWWIYFDDVAGSKIRPGRGNWIVWLYGHIPLAVGATAVGVAVKKAISFRFDEVPPTKYGWLLAGALAVTFLSVAIIDSVTERKQAELSDRTRVNVRVASAFVLLLIAQVGRSMTAGVFLGVVAAVCVAQVLFDMLMAPLEESRHLVHTSTREIAIHKHEPGAQRSQLRRDVTEAVRKGAPSELRRDLYFFFIEGSWTRVLIVFGFVYLLSNVLFAGLYMLDPTSIGSAEQATFGRAFAFSVQTMATIGYGAISPQTPYGDLIVTIEAAFGLLGVALATGLMFAKASRPRSSVLFSRGVVVTTRDGKRVLEFRAGNARGNEVVEAQVSVAVLMDEITVEGHHLRRIRDLKLVRERTPIFTLSWTVMHEIDADSPLADVDWEKPGDHLLQIFVTMLGHDATYGTNTHARHNYDPAEIRVGHRFVDVISELEDGRLMVDFHKFHDTVPDEEAA